MKTLLKKITKMFSKTVRCRRCGRKLTKKTERERGISDRCFYLEKSEAHKERIHNAY